MAKKSTTVYVTGTLYWAKIVGDKALVMNYDGDGKEWTMEVEPDDVSFLKEHRLLDRLKDPMAYAERLEERGEEEKAEAARKQAEGRGEYLIIRKPELTSNGDKNPPFKIIDENNDAWGEERLIGNGTKADFKLEIVDWGAGKKKSIYCKAIRITDHVPYEADDFAAMDKDAEEDEKPKAKTTKKSAAKKADSKGKAQELDDLEDDIPF